MTDGSDLGRQLLTGNLIEPLAHTVGRADADELVDAGTEQASEV
jgi:hypothetical protein